MLNKIKRYLKDSLELYSQSQQPPEEEYMMAWLVDEVDRLRKLTDEYESICS